MLARVQQDALAENALRPCSDFSCRVLQVLWNTVENLDVLEAAKESDKCSFNPHMPAGQLLEVIQTACCVKHQHQSVELG